MQHATLCWRDPSCCPPTTLPPLPPLAHSMTEFDGTCSLRLREPCVLDGAKYEAVVDVQAVPVLSGVHAGGARVCGGCYARLHRATARPCAGRTERSGTWAGQLRGLDDLRGHMASALLPRRLTSPPSAPTLLRCSAVGE